MTSFNRPYYDVLYKDMIRDKYPQKQELLNKLIVDKEWIALDVIEINNILFKKNETEGAEDLDMPHRAYDKRSILKILYYQSEMNLNNTEIVELYGMSRNTLAKWKKAYKKDLQEFEENL